MDAIAPLRCDPGPNQTSALLRVLLVLISLNAAWAAGPAVVADAVAHPSDAAIGGPEKVTEPGDIDDSVFASPTTHDHIGRVLVPVRINGRGPFRFIVDTGANHSTISPDLVRTLGLKAGSQSLMTLDGITGAAQVSYVSIDRLQAGDLTLDETALPVVWAPVMAGADGILGAAGLSEKSLLIDFQRNRVAIASHVTSTARAQTIKIHAARVGSGLIVLDTLVGGVRVAAVLDTGSERTLGNLALRDAVRGHKRPGQGFLARVTSVYGATQEVEPGEIQTAPTISIESLRITDVAIVYGDFHIFKIWQMRDKPAMILGMDVLGTVASLNIDFKNQTVYVGSALTRQRVPLTPHDLSTQQNQKN